MPSQNRFSLRHLSLFCLAFYILLAPALAQTQQSEPSAEEMRKRFLAERKQMFTATVGLELSSSRLSTITPLYNGRVNQDSLLRDSLAIVNPEVAKDFTMVEIQAEIGTDAVNVRLAIIYNKLSEPEWWKNKKEKELGRFTIPFDQSIRLTELLQFGIEPFEIKVISSKPVILKHDEYPRIFNPSNALEITEIEKSVAGYRVSFKNVSNKDIAALEIRSGGDGFGGGGLGHRGGNAFLPSGGTYENLDWLPLSNVEKYGITIKLIMYSDGTYEGDAKSATRLLAEQEGYKIQAAKLLPQLEKALNVADEELPEVFVRMEADLWQMPEAMDKASSIEFLKIKHPAFDEATIAMLYEEFKSGFYNARNTLLSNMGQAKRQVEEHPEGYSNADKASLFKHVLTHLKERMTQTLSSNN